MIIKDITFEDLNGTTITETYYFHLGKGEIAKLEMSVKGGLRERLQRLMSTENAAELIPIVEDILRRSIGRRSDDGERFVKDKKYTEEFMVSEACQELLYELLSDPKLSAEFFTNILPKSVRGMAQQVIETPVEEKHIPGVYPKTVDVNLPLPSSFIPTEEEIEKHRTRLVTETFARSSSELPAWLRENRDPSQAEIEETPHDVLMEYLRTMRMVSGK